MATSGHNIHVVGVTFYRLPHPLWLLKDVFSWLPPAVSIPPLLAPPNTLWQHFRACLRTAWLGSACLAKLGSETRFFSKSGTQQVYLICCFGTETTHLIQIVGTETPHLNCGTTITNTKHPKNTGVCAGSETRFWVPVFPAIEIACETRFPTPKFPRIGILPPHLASNAAFGPATLCK